jgi:hypothetical protein
VKPKLPSRSDLLLFAKFAACQLFIYFLFSVNARALAQGRIGWTFFSDLVFATVSYSLTRLVVKNESGWGQCGYIMGGAWGSVFAILVTKRLFGQ